MFEKNDILDSFDIIENEYKKIKASNSMLWEIVTHLENLVFHNIKRDPNFTIYNNDRLKHHSDLKEQYLEAIENGEVPHGTKEQGSKNIEKS